MPSCEADSSMTWLRLTARIGLRRNWTKAIATDQVCNYGAATVRVFAVRYLSCDRAETVLKLLLCTFVQNQSRDVSAYIVKKRVDTSTSFARNSEKPDLYRYRATRVIAPQQARYLLRAW